MTHYSYAELEGLWIEAGGPPSLAPLMAAIADAESGGDSGAQNPSGATGLWQILGNPFPGDAFDPGTNAKMAVAKWKEQGLPAWATYTSGAYRKFMRPHVTPQPPGGTHTTGDPGGGGVLHGLEDVVNAIATGGMFLPLHFLTGTGSSIGDVATAIAQGANDISTLLGMIAWLFVPNHWIRIICFILGVPLVGLGLIVITRGSTSIPIAVGPVSTSVSTGSIAPAMGILEITAGSILLFIAFHNLPPYVQSFPQLMSHVQSSVVTGIKSKEKPPVI